MPEIIKKILKSAAVILAILLVFALALLLWFKYMVSWRLTDVGSETSPDGRYRLRFQAVGEADFPFGPSHAKVTLYDGREKLQSFREDISDDGGAFRPENYSVEWMPYGVVITFSGSEQPDREVEIFFDGREAFEGYSDEEIAAILKDRYSIENVERITRESGGYSIRADGIDFRTDDRMALHDSYRQERFKALTDEVFPKLIQRSLSWEEEKGETPADTVYTPVIAMNGPGKSDLESYCADICEWLTYCFERLPYEEGGDAYSGFILTIPSPGDAKTRYSFSQNPYLAGFSENETEFYNGLYSFISSYIDGEYDDLIKADGIDAAKADEGYTEQYNPDITGETIALWGTYEPDVTYEAPDGREYGLVPVDRALGSSYYVLMSYAKKGDRDSAMLINTDPFCGSGGEANLLAFLGDGKTGFIGLTYNGGDDGLLYMTGDGGESFAEVSLPVPEITLPDGRLYNPFTVPEEVWEEPGKVYLKVGQGANGDYYNEELACHPCGIYVSENKGKTFSFLKEGKEEE